MISRRMGAIITRQRFSEDSKISDFPRRRSHLSEKRSDLIILSKKSFLVKPKNSDCSVPLQRTTLRERRGARKRSRMISYPASPKNRKIKFFKNARKIRETTNDMYALLYTFHSLTSRCALSVFFTPISWKLNIMPTEENDPTHSP